MNVLPHVHGAVDKFMYVTCPKCHKVSTYVVKCDVGVSHIHLTASRTCEACRAHGR
jgi:hypothetical protein